MKAISIILLIIALTSCCTPEKITLTPPPPYEPNRVTTDVQLIKEYQRALQRVKLLEKLYLIYFDTNYYMNEIK